MEGQFNGIDPSGLMPTLTAHGDTETDDNIQDIETSIFSSALDCMMSVPDNFQTGAMDFTLANTMDSFPQYISSTYLQNGNNAYSDFQLDSSVDNGTCYNLKGQVLPTTSCSTSGEENAQSSGIKIQNEDTNQQTNKQRARKTLVPDCAKDELYWTKRKRNNSASKKSRDEKKMREKQIVLRLLEMEYENASIKEEIGIIKAENHRLREALQRYLDTGINAYL